MQEITAMLKATPPFDCLTDSECALVAAQVRPARFEADALLVEAGKPADVLHIVTDGWAVAGNVRMPALFDVASLLFSLPVLAPYRAGPEGMHSLCLARPHLFTIARECPEFIVALLDLGSLQSCA